MSNNSLHLSVATVTQGAADFTPVVSNGFVLMISWLGHELGSLSHNKNQGQSQKWCRIGKRIS